MQIILRALKRRNKLIFYKCQVEVDTNEIIILLYITYESNVHKRIWDFRSIQKGLSVSHGKYNIKISLALRVSSAIFGVDYS